MRSVRLPRRVMACVAVMGFASAAQADLLVEAPGVINNAGIKEATAAFTQKTGIKVTFAGGPHGPNIMDAADGQDRQSLAGRDHPADGSLII